MLNYFLKIYHFYPFQGYKLQCAIESIDVHLILTKDICLKQGLFFPSTLLEAPTTPLNIYGQ